MSEENNQKTQQTPDNQKTQQTPNNQETQQTPNNPETQQTPNNPDRKTEIENIKETTQKDQDITPEQKDDSTIGQINTPYSATTSLIEKEIDWDSLSNTHNILSPKESNEKTKLYDNTISSIREKEIVIGKIIHVDKREVIVDINYKSTGIINTNEFRYNPDFKEGDEVEVYIKDQEDNKGQLVLSHQKAREIRSWERINNALETEEVLEGYVKCRTKGGMIVDVLGIETFLPGSQINTKPIRDYDVYVGKTMEIKVVKINYEFKNVVVSHKALIEKELEQQRISIIAKLEIGQVLEGIVKNITSYGVFIDLGGIDGLIHITDLSWGRINHPDEVVKLDQKLNVVILNFDEEKKRIALGLKQLLPQPWQAIDDQLTVGKIIKGKVVVLTDYGAFVEIMPGIEGLIHISEMSWSQHLRSVQDFFKIGDIVEAKILTFNKEERKISMGIKQLKPDPWENVETKYAIGTKHIAIVKNFTDFGIFVEIEDGIYGLIHISDLSWTKKIKHPSEFTKIKSEIEVVVLSIDKENRRFSFGYKQLEESPWEVFSDIFKVESIHEGTIIDMFDKGAIVSLPYGVEGFTTPRHLIKEDGSKAKLDEKLIFKIIEFNKEAKRIILSHSRTYEDLQNKKKDDEQKKIQQKKKETIKNVKVNIEKTTLGDISGLANLKNKIKNETSAIAKNKEKQKGKDTKEK